MCARCFDEEIVQFPFNEDFIEFESDFKSKLAKDDIILKGMGVENFPNSIYECAKCKTVWWLSLPDNEWRGFFVHTDTARYMLKNMRKENKRQTGNCLVFFAVLVVVMIIIFALKFGDMGNFLLNP